jgi:threonine-phosphate decarboxylase
MIRGHGGNIHQLALEHGCRPEAIIDMSSNVNPLGPPPGLIDHLTARLPTITALPPVDAAGIVEAFSHRHGIDSARVIAGNGTTQLIYAIPKAFNTREALIIGPTYADYADACAMHGVPYRYHLTADADGFAPDLDALDRDLTGIDTVFICNPNNPTGALIPGRSLASLCRAHPEVRFVVDESYLPFVTDGESESLMKRGPDNVAVLHSMSKIFRVPGLRIGFFIGPAGLTDAVRGYALPWSVNALAQEAVDYLMTAPTTDPFIRESRAFLSAQREALTAALADIPGLCPFPSRTSFILARLDGEIDGPGLRQALSRERILIRCCENFVGLSDRYVRFSLKTEDVNRTLVESIRRHLNHEPARRGVPT